MRIEYTVEMVPNIMAEAPLKSHLFYKMDHWKKVFSKKAVSFAPGDTLPSGGLIGKTNHDRLKMVANSINVVLLDIKIIKSKKSEFESHFSLGLSIPAASNGYK